MSDTTSNAKIYEGLEARYGKIARESNDDCCGDDSGSPTTTLYDVSVLEDLPVDITGLSLGCGDPVTIGEIQPGETVLDLGSGAGMDCFLAARQVGASGRVIGVDMTDDMLAKARTNKERLNAANVEFRKGHIEDLPVDNDSVDLIMSNCVINLSPQKERVFAEALRVLTPGGRVAISDIVTDGEFSEELRADVEKWAECVTGAIPTDDYIALMQQAGFTDITIVDKAPADDIVPVQEGMPRIYSARITARKPE